MAIRGMNHFNVLTDDLAATRRFFRHDPCGAKVELDFAPDEPVPGGR